VREGCFEYLKTILEFFHPAKLDTHAKALLEAVRVRIIRCMPSVYMCMCQN
jgi:hypothetical protein